MLSLDAIMARRSITGTLRPDAISPHQAPGFTKVLQDAGLRRAGGGFGPGLALTRAEIPFSIDAQGFASAQRPGILGIVGVHGDGKYALATGEANLDATIVPAYWLNALPGKIPVVG